MVAIVRQFSVRMSTVCSRGRRHCTRWDYCWLRDAARAISNLEITSVCDASTVRLHFAARLPPHQIPLVGVRLESRVVGLHANGRVAGDGI